MLKPNILLICIDSFRADKFYGNNKTSKTPHIDSLIKNGIYFNQAFSTSDYTVSSLGSIFTGLYPFNAGISSESYYKFYSKSVNYVSTLKEHGYHAYATIPRSFSNLGFTYDFENKDDVYVDSSHSFHLAGGVGEQIIQKLDSKNMIEPWIYFIHLDDLHQGSTPPKEFDHEEYGNDKYERMISAIDVWVGKILQKINLNSTLVVLTADHGEYIRSIKHGDKEISFEFTKIRNMGGKIGNMTPLFIYPLLSKLSITIREIITKIKLIKLRRINLTPYQKRSLFYLRNDADRCLYDELVHVPLVFAGYGITPRTPISHQVTNIDIFPTIAEMVGLPSIKKDTHGKSLVPLFQGKKLEELPIYMENAIFPITHNFQKLANAAVGIRTAKYKYFRKIKNPREKYLYDLEKDPLEENNIANIRPDIIEQMEKMLIELRKDSLPESEQEKMSEEETKKVQQELRKLGYI